MNDKALTGLILFNVLAVIVNLLFAVLLLSHGNPYGVINIIGIVNHGILIMLFLTYV